MKRLSIGIVFLLGIFSTQLSQAQHFEVKVHPLSAPFGYLAGDIGFYLNGKNGFTVGLRNSSLDIGELFVDERSLNSTIGVIDYRFFLGSSEEALEGFYIGPYAKYRNREFTNILDSDNTRNGSVVINDLAGGVVLGATPVFDNGLLLDFYLGLGFRGELDRTYDDAQTKNYQEARAFPITTVPIDLRLGATIGFRF